LYALSAFGGYISVENESWLNKVLGKAKRYGYTDSVLTFSKLLEQSDEQLLSRVVCLNHCLFHLLEKKTSLCSTCRSDLEVTLLIYLGINAILAGNLLSIETCIQGSREVDYHVFYVFVRAVCTMCTLGGLSLLTAAYIRILSILVFEFVYLCLRSFLDISISCIMYLTFHYSM